MNNYNPASLRRNLTAAICALLFSATCLIGVAGPAQAATSVPASV